MKVVRWLDHHFEEMFLLVFSSVMVVVIALQVFMRYVIGSSLPWSEELARYCFIWLVYLGISYGVKKQRHIKVDVVLLFLKDKGQIMVNIFANLLFLVFAFYVIFYGGRIVSQLLQWGQSSPALHVPMGWVYAATPIGMGLTAIRIIQQLVKQIMTILGRAEFEVKTEQDLIFEANPEQVDQKTKR
ncbi:TRAP transporter small permease [Halalkalibacterium halodurans]|uniref:TRAP transporter small permease n=1 Tax=Halalkalibacterium halodurans TaxID=86665 RepID=UPI002AAA0146|nr:TRAP transporter small permease [Halalkalibacterium halodurans]MDY7224709.1 TRAP transporter small permease [Halalkalibacterium halodurans]MDY7243932.1 TRAP transporter small permease [Halalkalibacterium halodurans]